MSNITFGLPMIEQQLKASNRLFRSGYEAGYAAGIKYALDKMDECVSRMTPASSLADPLDPCDVGSPVDRA